MLKIWYHKYGNESSENLIACFKERGFAAEMVVRGTHPRHTDRDVIINFGNSYTPSWINQTRLGINHPDAVKISSHKIRTLERFNASGVPTVRWTTNPEIAKTWGLVVVRNKLKGKDGDGIFLWNSDDGELPEAPLYTEYKNNYKEYRVHVFNGEVIDFLEKRQRRGGANDVQIRTYTNRWIFARQDVVRPPNAEEVAIQAVNSIGLMFGGVDLIWNRRENRCYVLEVNSAPGMWGQNVEIYADKFVDYITRNAPECLDAVPATNA